MPWSFRNFTALNILILTTQSVLQRFNIGITSASNLSRLQDIALDTSRSDLEFIQAMGQNNYEPLFTLLSESKSQLRQDLLVLANTNYKRGGYFVEFGATNGILLSNSFLLEQSYGWKGILAEPGRVWNAELLSNRPNSKISTQCVWERSNQILDFNETQDPENSTISMFRNKKPRYSRYRKVNHYEVKTISLMDLLIENNAPEYIDYLSIDTEGSELRILQTFDFSKFSFGIISIEHNYREDREPIFNLLTNAGYKRRFENISKWDDWYFK